MRKRLVWAGVLVLAMAAGAAAQSLGVIPHFEDPFANLFLIRQSVPTGYSCMNVEPGYHFAGTQHRDVVATFVRYRKDWTVERVCFLRPAQGFAQWSTD